VNDAIHPRLKGLLEVPTTRWLWTEADAITFVPRVLSAIYGDGRSLWRFSTINDRPAYWIIRGDSGWQAQESGWQTQGSGVPGGAPDFGDFTDEILTSLEEEFGSARCGYSGASLHTPPEERDCHCEQCSDPKNIAEWPMVDDDGGCFWDRISWPTQFSTIDHLWARWFNLLATEEEAAFSSSHPRLADEFTRWNDKKVAL